MITIQEAIKIASEWNPKYDTYQEYEDAYVFFIDDGVIKHGGGDNCLIVEKANGNKLRFAQYYMDAYREIAEVGEPVRFKPREKTLKLKYIGESFGERCLTNGIIYAAFDENEDFYRVIDDSFVDRFYLKENPAPLDGSSPGGKWEIIAEDDLPAENYNHIL